MAVENRSTKIAKLMFMLGLPIEMASCSAAVTGTNNNEVVLLSVAAVGAAMMVIGIICASAGKEKEEVSNKNIKVTPINKDKEENKVKVPRNPKADITAEEEVWLERKN